MLRGSRDATHFSPWRPICLILYENQRIVGDSILRRLRSSHLQRTSRLDAKVFHPHDDIRFCLNSEASNIYEWLQKMARWQDLRGTVLGLEAALLESFISRHSRLC